MFSFQVVQWTPITPPSSSAASECWQPSLSASSFSNVTSARNVCCGSQQPFAVWLWWHLVSLFITTMSFPNGSYLFGWLLLFLYLVSALLCLIFVWPNFLEVKLNNFILLVFQLYYIKHNQPIWKDQYTWIRWLIFQNLKLNYGQSSSRS